jgi:hypothetical protein
MAFRTLQGAGAERFYRERTPVVPWQIPPLLKSVLPLTGGIGASEVLALAVELASALGLSGGAVLVQGTGSRGILLERNLRIRAWDGNDLYRLLLHRVGIRAYQAADRSDGWQQLSSAFAAVAAHVEGDLWRSRLASLSQGLDEGDRAFVRRFFRAAQQTWTRAARWSSVMPASATSPFDVLVRLGSGGAWPLGYWDGRLVVFLLDHHASAVPFEIAEPADNLVPPAAERPVFLATGFRDKESGERWRRHLESLGYHVLYGPVPERGEPIEIQVGRRIREAAAVLAVVDTMDPDFGLPLWIEQELEYAIARKRPAAIVGAAMNLSLGTSPVREISIPSGLAAPRDVPGVADWLAEAVLRST